MLKVIAIIPDIRVSIALMSQAKAIPSVSQLADFSVFIVDLGYGVHSILGAWPLCFIMSRTLAHAHYLSYPYTRYYLHARFFFPFFSIFLFRQSLDLRSFSSCTVMNEDD